MKFKAGSQTKGKQSLILSLGCLEKLDFEAALFQQGLPHVVTWVYEQENKSFICSFKNFHAVAVIIGLNASEINSNKVVS